MRTSLISLGSLLWAGVAIATPCKPATPSSASASSSSAAPSASPSSPCSIVGIQDPSFANGLDGWTTNYSYGTYLVTPTTDCGDGVATCVELYAHSGNAGASGEAAVFQTDIPVVDGQSYTLTFDYRVTVPGICIMGLFFNGQPTAGVLNVDVNVWYTYTNPFIAVGDTLSIAPFQRCYTGSMTIQITNVKLVSCPTEVIH